MVREGPGPGCPVAEVPLLRLDSDSTWIEREILALHQAEERRVEREHPEVRLRGRWRLQEERRRPGLIAPHLEVVGLSGYGGERSRAAKTARAAQERQIIERCALVHGEAIEEGRLQTDRNRPRHRRSKPVPHRSRLEEAECRLGWLPCRHVEDRCRREGYPGSQFGVGEVVVADWRGGRRPAIPLQVEHNAATSAQRVGHLEVIGESGVGVERHGRRDAATAYLKESQS